MKNFINLNTAMFLAMMLGLAIVTSCDNEESIAPAPSSINEIGEAASTCSGSETLNGTVFLQGSAVGQYCPAGRIFYEFPTGICSPTPELSFEGQFNSFIRPLTSGWFVGTIPLSQVNLPWGSMTFTTKDGNEGPEPNENCGGFVATTDNVVGANGTIGADDFGLGYYSYDDSLRKATPISAVVVWQGTADDPAGATNGYVIRVTNLDPLPPPPGFRSKVEFTYRKAL